MKEFDCTFGKWNRLIILKYISEKFIISLHFLRITIAELLYRYAPHESLDILIRKASALNARRSSRGGYEHRFFKLSENLRIEYCSRHPFALKVVNHPHL